MNIGTKVIGKYNQIKENIIVGSLPYVSIYNMKWLSYDIQQLHTKEILISNDFYGNANTIKKYCGLNERYTIKASLEHASYMAKDFYWDVEVNHDLPGIITQGCVRRDVLKKVTSKSVYVVGPYIAYAKSFYSERKKRKLKKGKTLLVFPMHSATHMDIDYDMELFISEIERVKKDFDTVRICMYWKDILRGSHMIYRQRGYEIVSAGHLYDKCFLSRLRSIIEMSDCVMANEIGTYIGQAVYFKKPVYLYRQEGWVSNADVSTVEFDTRQDTPYYEKMFQLFGELSDEITREQYELCDYFWGIQSVLDCHKMKKLLDSLEKEYCKD